MKKIFVLLFLILLVACSGEQKVKQKDKVITLTDASFATEVLNAQGLVVVDFWAEWCGPCRLIKPYIHELAVEYANKVKVASVDVDKNIEIARQYNIQNIPAVFFFKDGKIVQKIIGARSKSEFSRTFDKYL